MWLSHTRAVGSVAFAYYYYGGRQCGFYIIILKGGRQCGFHIYGWFHTLGRLAMWLSHTRVISTHLGGRYATWLLHTRVAGNVTLMYKGGRQCDFDVQGWQAM